MKKILLMVLAIMFVTTNVYAMGAKPKTDKEACYHKVNAPVAQGGCGNGWLFLNPDARALHNLCARQVSQECTCIYGTPAQKAAVPCS